MAIWSQSSIQDINEGVVANDGSGDNIRDAFLKVDENFYQISKFLSNTELSFLNANVIYNLEANYADIANLFVANATGITSRFTGNSYAGNLIANVGLYSLGTTVLSGNTVTNNIVVNGTTTLVGNVTTYNHIVPGNHDNYDLGTPTQRFRTLYVTDLVSTTETITSSDAGLLLLHANLSPSDVKDVGILGKFSEVTSNSYAFFGFQHLTKDFVYKITPTDATAGNSVVYDGLYGNGHLGSLLLSNTEATTANTIIVSGNGRIDGNLYVAGNVYAAGNAVITSATIESMVVTGNVQGNLNVSGTLYSNGSPLLSVDTAGPYNLFSGGLILGNVNVASTFNATSPTNAALVVGGGIGVGGNVIAAGLVGPTYGTIQTANQPNITGLGTVGNLNVSGTIAGNVQATTVGVTTLTATSINTTSLAVSGLLSAAILTGASIGTSTSVITGSSITGATVTGSAIVGSTGNFNNITANTVSAKTIGNSGATLTGTLSTNAQPNVTSLGTLGSLNVSGNVAAGGFVGTFYGAVVSTGSATVGDSTTTGNVSVTGNVTATNLNSTQGSFNNIAGTVITAAQPNITSIGSSGLTVAGNTSIANTLYGLGLYDFGNRVISTTAGLGNLTLAGASITLTPMGPGATGAGSATNIPTVRTDIYGRVTSLSTTTVSTTFGVTGTSGLSSVTSAGVTSGVLTFTSANGVTVTATQANSTSTTLSIGTPQDLRTTATPTFQGVLPAANVTYNLGSTTAWWNNIYGNAVHALYADLAEKYVADVEYQAGTVVIFGGEKEITIASLSHDDRIAGVISTNPAYLMNSESEGLPVALTGRVPCKVLGPISKGDKLVASGTPGYAMRLDKNLYEPGCIIGKSLEDFIGHEGIIEVVVGRL